MEIRILARQGLGIKEIVRQTGYSRNTIRKYLREPETVPQYTPRPPRPGKLTPFEDYIGQRLEHAAPDWIPAAVLYREIQLLGYHRPVSSFNTGKKGEFHERLFFQEAQADLNG